MSSIKLLCKKLSHKLAENILIIKTKTYKSKFDYKDILRLKKIKKSHKKFRLLLCGAYKKKNLWRKKVVQ